MTFSSSSPHSPHDLSQVKGVVGRFAPSPSGNLHLGSLRTAFAAWLAARSAGGKLFYRVEDTDQERARPEIVQQQKEDLEWLGMDFDAFNGAPYLQQSKEATRYQKELDRVASHCTACTCSRKVLLDLRLQHQWPGDYHPPQCPKPAREESHSAALRFQPGPGEFHIDDLIRGPMRFYPNQSNGPFVVRRADGFFAYQLVVVLDDIFMGVNQVVRGDDILHATGMQLSLYSALGAKPPRYAHLPLILNESGEKFSKSHGTPDVRFLQHRGVTRESILTFLSHSLGLTGPEEVISEPRRLVKAFAFDKIPRESTLVDLQTLSYRIGAGPSISLRPT